MQPLPEDHHIDTWSSKLCPAAVLGRLQGSVMMQGLSGAHLHHPVLMTCACAVLRCAVPIVFVLRPLGVLLDNVANGWTYNTIRSSDVTARVLAGSGMVSSAV